MTYRSPLSKALGLGATGHGTRAWWHQRATALAIIPLIFWFAGAIACLPGLEYTQVKRWLATPWNNLLLLTFISIVTYHTILGLQIVIEDYIHNERIKTASLLGMKGIFLFLGLTAFHAALRIIFTN